MKNQVMQILKDELALLRSVESKILNKCKMDEADKNKLYKVRGQIMTVRKMLRKVDKLPIQVGSRVRITSNKANSLNKIGETGVVTEIDSKYETCRVYGDITKKDYGNFSCINDLELI